MEPVAADRVDPVGRIKLDRRLSLRSFARLVVLTAAVAMGSLSAAEVENRQLPDVPSETHCGGAFDCIGIAIDSGDPILVQMGYEMSDMVTDTKAGTVVLPTEGPIANVRKMLSRENAGLSIVPSDMLIFLESLDEPVVKDAGKYLRFIMTIGRKVVHLVTRKSIQRIQDLDGKRVVVGPDNTAMWVVSNNLLRIHDVNPAKRLQLKPPIGIAAVLLDLADAVFVIGDAPISIVQRLAVLDRSEPFKPYTEQIHLLPIELEGTNSEYRPETVHYPGVTENLRTVAILPTLVSYDFSLKSTPYFNRRCRELARVGRIVRSRLDILREKGHRQWKETSWELEAGSWKKDPCFFGAAEAVAAGER